VIFFEIPALWQEWYRAGVLEKIARAAIRVLDENPHSGLPKKVNFGETGATGRLLKCGFRSSKTSI
jgi:hypothetical protein